MANVVDVIDKIVSNVELIQPIIILLVLCLAGGGLYIAFLAIKNKTNDDTDNKHRCEDCPNASKIRELIQANEHEHKALSDCLAGCASVKALDDVREQVHELEKTKVDKEYFKEFSKKLEDLTQNTYALSITNAKLTTEVDYIKKAIDNLTDIIIKRG